MLTGARMNSERKTLTFLYLGETAPVRRVASAREGRITGSFKWAPWAFGRPIDPRWSGAASTRTIYISSMHEHPPLLCPWRLRCELISPAADLHRLLPREDLVQLILRNRIDNFIFVIDTTQDDWITSFGQGGMLAESFHKRTGLRPCLQLLTDQRHTEQLEQKLSTLQRNMGFTHAAIRITHHTARREIWPALWHEVWCDLRRLISHTAQVSVELAAAE